MIDIRILKDMSSVRQFNVGDVILRDGESGEEMYIILKGHVGVYKNYRDFNELLITMLMPGSFFGEVTLFSKRKRSATIVAHDNVVVLAINRSNAFKFFSTEHKAALSLCRTLSERIADGVRQCELLKTPSSTNIYHSKFFPDFQQNYNLAIARPDECYIRVYAPGAVLVQEGAKIDKLCIILRGRMGVYRNHKRPGEVKLAELSIGNFISDVHYAAGLATETIAAIEETQAIVLGDKEFVRFFECEPKAYSLMQILCDRIDLLNSTQASLNSHKNNNVGYSGHILFPDTHKKYRMEIFTDGNYLKLKSFTCPVCGKLIGRKVADPMKLKSLRVGDDFRMYYAELEPIYYDIVTCPECWYTAHHEYFERGSATGYLFSKRMQPYQDALTVNFSDQLDINDVFTSYYLALFCVDLCFTKDKDLIFGKLWLRLSWLYDSCGDENMAKNSTEKACKYFMAAYNTTEFSAKTANPMMIIAGVLCHKVGDDENARHLLLSVAKARGGNDNHKEHAARLMKEYKLGGAT